MIVCDFKREYQLSPREMYDMPTLHFLWYLNGLSENSNWVKSNQKKDGKGSSGGSGGRTSRHRRR